MKLRMYANTRHTESIKSSNYIIEELKLKKEEAKSKLTEILKKAMEEIDDPDIRGKSPDRYITNLIENRFGEFDESVILICKLDLATVGIIIALPNKELIEKSYNIMTLGVYINYRCKMIGSLLINSLKENLRNMEIEKVTLDVHIENEKAIKLYKKFGFKEIEL